MLHRTFEIPAHEARAWSVPRQRRGPARGRANRQRGEPLLRMATRSVGSAVVVRAEGEIDRSCRRVWEQHLEVAAARADPPGPVVLDLTELGFLDSGGLRVIEDAHFRWWGRGTLLRVASSRPIIAYMIQTVGLGDVLEIYPSVAKALAEPAA